MGNHSTESPLITVEEPTMQSPNFSFKGWNLKKFFIGFKKPGIVIIAWILTQIAGMSPDLGVLAGLSAERIWAFLEYFVKKF